LITKKNYNVIVHALYHQRTTSTPTATEKLVLGTSVDVSVDEVMMDVMFSKNNAENNDKEIY
jgi:hypothetical protein